MPNYIEILLKPKQFLIALPDERITFASLAIIMILWANSVIQGLVVLKEYAFNVTLIFQELTILMFGIIVFSSLFVASSKIIKRKITFNKIVNVICFSQIPRMYFVTIFTLIYLIFPEVSELNNFNKIINAIIFLLTIYSVVLTVYGVLVNVQRVKKI